MMHRLIIGFTKFDDPVNDLALLGDSTDCHYQQG
jgi:hypothetical protein